MPTPPQPQPPLAALPGNPGADALLERFISVAAERGLRLYPEQEEAILELFSGNNVILNTPTGSGKSLVAAAFHFKALCAGERSVYTCPIKALVNEKFLALCRDFGPENVGMMTGDASVNPQAPLLCCTAEILANMALARGERCDLRAVIMDEFHYYSDAERGYAWQVPPEHRRPRLGKRRFPDRDRRVRGPRRKRTRLRRGPPAGRRRLPILRGEGPIPPGPRGTILNAHVLGRKPGFRRVARLASLGRSDGKERLGGSFCRAPRTIKSLLPANLGL